MSKERNIGVASSVSKAEAIEELSKFLVLAGEIRKPMTMFSAFIDEAWHDLLSDPEAYAEFSNAACGSVIGHIAGTAPEVIGGEPYFGWTSSYQERYGPLPSIWFADKTGRIDHEAHEHFVSTGEIRAAWSCTPSSGISNIEKSCPAATWRDH